MTPKRQADIGRNIYPETVIISTHGPAPNKHFLQIKSGNINLSLADFLSYCAESLEDRTGNEAYSEVLAPLRDAFINAGLKSLKRGICTTNWLHLGLVIGEGCEMRELYLRISDLARELLDDSVARNFYFLHKPPGIRLRFETTTSGAPQLDQEVYRRVTAWQNEGVVKHFLPGVYEPEQHLFGGPQSMQNVHELFTIDALAWLDFHKLEASAKPRPAWALSLVMLRAMFTGLGITDLEDLDVWDRIRRQMGRCLPAELTTRSEFLVFAGELRSQWHCMPELHSQLSAEVRDIANVFEQAIVPMTRKWREEYFDTREAYIGPREAISICTIFHWNRAALSFTRQSMLTEALATWHSS